MRLIARTPRLAAVPVRLFYSMRCISRTCDTGSPVPRFICCVRIPTWRRWDRFPKRMDYFST